MTTAPSACPLCSRLTVVRLATQTARGREWYVAECRSCRLVFTDPQPGPDDIRGFYEGDYHSALRHPGASETAFGAKFDDYCEWLTHYVKPGRSLDVGCATGLFVKKLKDRGFDAEGYEANELSAAWGRSHYGVTIHVGILNPGAFEPASYSLVTLCDVLEHTPNPLEYLRDLRQLLRPNGYVMVMFPDIWSIESLYYRALSRLFRRDWIWKTCSVPEHIWNFTPRTARRVFEQAGFQVVGYRRRQDLSMEPISLRTPLDLIDIPPRILQFRPLGNRFGLQMHFLLQPRQDTPR